MYAIQNVSKNYGQLKVLDDISIDFPEAGTTVILGPSGCGKTTLLNIISGLIKPDAGTVQGFCQGELSFVFQEDRLIPWKTVGDNIRFVLKGKMDKEEIKGTIDRTLGQFGLLEYIDYYPNKLSGGMKQRIQMLRAFAFPADILLMDEPFKSLDLSNKRAAMDFLKALLTSEKRTCILVTHDLDEAIALGEQIVILTDKPARVKKVMTNPYALTAGEKSRSKVRKILEQEVLLGFSEDK